MVSKRSSRHVRTETCTKPLYRYLGQELFRQCLDRCVGHSQTKMRLLVSGPAGVVQPLHLVPIRGQRSTAIGRNPVQQLVQWCIEPDRHTVRIDQGAIVRIDKCSAAGGHNNMTQGDELV